jgi:GGDEF domain-containing protein
VSFSPNLYLAALGPLSELFGLVVIVAVFALLRGQADRRNYFRSWELSWVFFAVSLTAGVFYERFVDPESVFYPASAATTFIAAAAHLSFRLLALAALLTGIQDFVRGTRNRWLTRLAVPAGVALTFAVDTAHTPLAPLTIEYGAFAAIAYGYAALAFTGLPRSRRSLGSGLAAVCSAGIALIIAGLTTYFLLQRAGHPIAGMPWAVRFARYGFYSDLLLQMGLAWAMVRLLLEDGRHENDDTVAWIRLLQNREQRPDIFDAKTHLLGRRAFDALIGLDFARASFGSVARLHVTNFARLRAMHTPAVAEALLTNIAGVLDSSVRPHDRVYRWSDDELLIVMPRAVPGVARARIEFLVGRTAPLAMAGLAEPLRVEGAVSVEPYRGGEELVLAAATVSRG